MPKKKPEQFANRDLHEILRFPKLSWSSISSFQYDPREWYDKYVLGIRSEPNEVMLFGTEVGERLVAEPDFLKSVPRPPIYEQELKGKFNGIDLIGHLDGFGLKEKLLLEYKTSSSKTRWTARSVYEHGQIDFYCLLIWLNFKIKPEDLYIRLVYIPVEQIFIAQRDGSTKSQMVLSNAPVQVFPIKKTMADMLKFGSVIISTHKAMKEYIKKRK